MSSDLEDVVRQTLSARAPKSARPADWADLRSRATRRSLAGRATVAVGAAAVGTIALTTPWSTAPSALTPATSAPSWLRHPTPPSQPTRGLPSIALPPAVVEASLQYQRDVHTDWSTGPADLGTINRALGTLMASSQITDPTAQPWVIWSSAGARDDDSQGPEVLAVVEQADGWVVGFWDELIGQTMGDCAWTPPMVFGTMSSGSLDDRIVGVSIPCSDDTSLDVTRVFFVAPTLATRVVRVETEDPNQTGVPIGTETLLGTGFGDYGFSNPPTLRAYAADGGLLDEQTFGE